MQKNSGKYHFSLIEMLIVTGIIILIISLLLPAINSVRSKARQVQCVNHERQISIAFSLFMKDNNQQPELINADDGWSGYLMPYITDSEIYICPDDQEPNPSSDISNYYVDIRQTVYHLTFTDGPFSKVIHPDDLPKNAGGVPYYRVYIDRKYGSNDPNHYTDYLVGQNEFILALEDIHNTRRSDMDFNDLVLKFGNSNAENITYTYDKSSSTTVSEIYINKGDNIVAGTKLYKTADGETHYSTLLANVTNVLINIGDSIEDGDPIFDGTGGGYDAEVLEKNAGYTYDLYKEGHGLITKKLKGNYKFQIQPGKKTSYGVNMTVANVFMDPDKVMMIDYPNKRVLHTGLVLGGVNTGEVDDWSRTSWDKDNNGSPDFARHTYQINTLMADGSVSTMSPDELNPMDSFNAEKYWEPNN